MFIFFNEPRKGLLFCLFAGLIFFVSGCASGSLNNARQEYFHGGPQRAIELLPSDEKVPTKDMLLYLMEKGTLLHNNGNYPESIIAFLKASRLMEHQDRISISEQAASLITTERITEYKGEYSERLLVHTYLMMNYLLINRFEDALVEAKQALKLLDKFPEALESDFFTRALIGLCFENLSLKNDAFLVYKEMARDMHDPFPAAIKAYQLAVELGFDDEAESMKEYLSEEDILPMLRNREEIVLFISRGRAPVKVPGNIVLPPSVRFSWARYVDKMHIYSTLGFSGQAEAVPPMVISTDTGDVAKASLKDRAARIFAKETARVTAKEVASQSAGDEYGLIAEVVVRAALFLMEEPDTRCWHTLPARLTLARILVNNDELNVTVLVMGDDDIILEEIEVPAIGIPPNGKRFFAIRLDE